MRLIDNRFGTEYKKKDETIRKTRANGETATRIAAIREATGLSQNAFADRYGIPISNIHNWEQGLSKCPQYVVELIRREVEIDIGRKITYPEEMNRQDDTPENSGDRELRKPRRREEDSLFPFDKYGHETERGQAVDDYMREMRDGDRV